MIGVEFYQLIVFGIGCIFFGYIIGRWQARKKPKVHNRSSVRE